MTARRDWTGTAHISTCFDAVWELRDRLTTYDASYLALARWLDCKLLSVDGGLATAARAEGRLVEFDI